MRYKPPEERMLEYATKRGLFAGVKTSLLIKFGTEGAAILPTAQSLQGEQRVREFLETIPEAKSIDELRKRFADAASV